MIGFFTVLVIIALQPFWPFLLVQKRPNAKGIPSGKGHKESELVWMAIILIVSLFRGHPALRQRILWGLGLGAFLCSLESMSFANAMAGNGHGSTPYAANNRHKVRSLYNGGSKD